MSEELSSESLQKSIKTVGELYPVLENQDGKILDGTHRLESNPKHHRKTIQTKNRMEEILVRLHAHHRRRIPQEETKALLIELAHELETSGIECRSISAELAKHTPYSDRYIQMLLPEKYKQPEKVEAGQKGGQVSAELAHQTVKTQDTVPEMLVCVECKTSTRYNKESYKQHYGQWYCPNCYPKAVQRNPVPDKPEATIIKPKETPEHRRAVMKPQHSQMEQDLLAALTEKGYHPVTDQSFCVQSTTPDFYFPDKQLAVYIDGHPHKKHEEHDTELRTLLAQRHNVHVVSIPYDANTKTMQTQILAQITETLK